VAEGPDRVRLDKWLWAARFFKTRRLAVEAIQGGKVRIGDAPAKPAKDVRAGDRLTITSGQTTWTVDVLGVNEHRRPASEAQLLYEETPESRELRERRASERRAAPPLGADLPGRPSKRDRRQIESLRGARRDPRRGA
jgi:ribosome-associated heat shock protein Hsp15